MEKKTLGLIVVLLLIALASQDEKMLVKVEGRVCESQSHGYKGPCVRDHNCALVCRNEGFSGGNCRGFRRRCFCSKHC